MGKKLNFECFLWLAENQLALRQFFSKTRIQLKSIEDNLDNVSQKNLYDSVASFAKDFAADYEKYIEILFSGKRQSEFLTSEMKKSWTEENLREIFQAGNYHDEYWLASTSGITRSAVLESTEEILTLLSEQNDQASSLGAHLKAEILDELRIAFEELDMAIKGLSFKKDGN